MANCKRLFLCCAFLTFQSSFAQKEYVDEVLKLAEQHSINRDSVDFSALRADAYGRLGTAETPAETYPVVRYILSQLKDNHSFLMEKQKVLEWQSTSKTPEKSREKTFRGAVVYGDIGVIEMFGFGSGDPVTLTEYADEMQALIKSMDRNDIKGWILDVRSNTGGNCWPMLAGVGPLLGEGTCGYFQSGNSKSRWYYKDGKSGVDSNPICSVSKEPYRLLKQTPVAVLTGSRTASSGEVVVTAFRGKENARSFGQATGGYSTGNQNFTLSDGSMIFLTTSVYVDRNMNRYGSKITPDELVPFEYQTQPSEEDPVIKAAVEWIRKRK